MMSMHPRVPRPRNPIIVDLIFHDKPYLNRPHDGHDGVIFLINTLDSEWYTVGTRLLIHNYLPRQHCCR
jgi:hypothetical protein